MLYSHDSIAPYKVLEDGTEVFYFPARGPDGEPDFSRTVEARRKGDATKERLLNNPWTDFCEGR